MPKQFNPTDWITTKEAAELTGYHAVHIRRLLRDGTIDGRRFGRAWMVDRDGLQDYAEQMKERGRRDTILEARRGGSQKRPLDCPDKLSTVYVCLVQKPPITLIRRL